MSQSGGYGPPGGPMPPAGGYGYPTGPGAPGAPGFPGQTPGFAPGGPPFGGDGGRAAAESKVKPAAITLLVFSGIGILLQLFALAMNVLGTGLHVAGDAGAEQIMSGAAGVMMNIVGVAIGAFSIFAFFKMMNLQNRGLVMAGVILSMIPCLGSCWCVNLWVGIWALIVLSDENVKSAFR